MRARPFGSGYLGHAPSQQASSAFGKYPSRIEMEEALRHLKAFAIRATWSALIVLLALFLRKAGLHEAFVLAFVTVLAWGAGKLEAELTAIDRAYEDAVRLREIGK